MFISETILTLTIGPFLRKYTNKFHQLHDGNDTENLLAKFKESLDTNLIGIERQLKIFDKYGILDLEAPEPESKVRRLMRLFENV